MSPEAKRRTAMKKPNTIAPREKPIPGRISLSLLDEGASIVFNHSIPSGEV
jgi:hypothetical protein